MANRPRRPPARGRTSVARAFAIQQRAARMRFDWPDAAGPLAKVKEEVAELEATMRTGAGARRRIVEELGDVLFAVVNLARKLAIDPGRALERANDKFSRRFAGVERLASKRGVDFRRASLEELDALWEEVKRKA